MPSDYLQSGKYNRQIRVAVVVDIWTISQLQSSGSQTDRDLRYHVVMHGGTSIFAQSPDDVHIGLVILPRKVAPPRFIGSGECDWLQRT